MPSVHGDKCFMRPSICVCCMMFAHGQESVVDKERSSHSVQMTAAVIAGVIFFQMILLKSEDKT